MTRLFVLLLGFLACTFSVAAQDPPALKGATPAERARLAPLIEGAAKEGSLAYIDSIFQPATHDALVAAFKAHYGLPESFKVGYTLTGTGASITRIEQEIAADRIITDVVSVAAPTWWFEKAEAGHILEYRSPEHAAYRKVFELEMGRDGYFAANGGYLLVPMWNPEKLDFKGTSLKDVLAHVPPGRMTHGDVKLSATYLATYIGYAQVMPADYWPKLAALKPNYIVRSEQIAQRLVTGEDLFSFSGMPSRAYQSNLKGAKLKFMIPDEGVVLLLQNTGILKKAAHPNAARLWIDFTLSEAGQSIIGKGEATISARSGFMSPLPEYAPEIDSLKLIKVDWKALSSDKLQERRNEWLKIFQP